MLPRQGLSGVMVAINLTFFRPFRYSTRSRFRRSNQRELSMSTYFPSGTGLAENRKWHVVDAAGQTVGRLATEIASVLTGKRSPRWTPFMDMGDHVIVINARKAVFKGSKAEQK